MTQKTFVGLYDTETALLAAIKDLDEKGIEAENMYVIARNEEDVEKLRRRTSEDLQSVPSNWLDRFIGQVAGENHMRSMLVEVGFDEADVERYEMEIKSGKWLLYIDGELEKTAYEIYQDRQREETNPFDRPLSEAERLNQNDDSPVGIGEDGLPKNDYRDSVMTDGYEDTRPVAREDLLFGRAGAEALIDRTDYEANATHLDTPSQVRGTPTKERAIRRNRPFEENNQSRNGISNTHSFMESQMDRQDTIVETSDGKELSHNYNAEFRTISKDAGKQKKPIVIDLRNVDKVEDDAGTWLLPKNRKRD